MPLSRTEKLEDAASSTRSDLLRSHPSPQRDPHTAGKGAIMSPTRRPAAGAPKPEATTRVALYLRISTDEEHQPFSLEAQEHRLTRVSGGSVRTVPKGPGPSVGGDRARGRGLSLGYRAHRHLHCHRADAGTAPRGLRRVRRAIIIDRVIAGTGLGSTTGQKPARGSGSAPTRLRAPCLAP